MKKEIELKEKICEIGRRVYDKGFVAANDGNISVKLSDNEILVTPTGVSKGFMKPDMIIKVNSDGNVLEGTSSPTSELKMHLKVYKDKPEIQAVVHAHPPYATAFAIAGLPLDRATMPESVVLLGTIPVAPYGTPSTDEVPNALRGLVSDHNGVLLENHGALTWGRDIEQAYFFMESLEFTSKINWIARQMNGDRELSQKNVDRLLELKKSMGMYGSAPTGSSCNEDLKAKKVTPPLESSLTQHDLKTIVESVTAAVIKELKKIR